MTVSELRDKLENYLDKYGDAEITIIKTNKDRTRFDYGTIYETECYDDFYILVGFGGIEEDV